jgi:signal transduction histidine kinase
MRFVIVAWLFISTSACCQVLNFSQYDFDKNGSTNLKGKWEFYWGKLLDSSQINSGSLMPDIAQLPHGWVEDDRYEMFGVGTYHVRLILPKNVKGQLSIYIPYVRCAAKVFVNGNLIDSLGRVGDRAHYQSQLKGLLVALPSTNEIDLIIQVANYEFRWGGISSNIKLGKTSSIVDTLHTKNGFDIFFVGSILAMALYLVTMYFLYREGYSFLFLALICLAVVLRSLTTESGSLFLPGLFSDVGWTLWKKIEFFSVYSVVALFPLYVSHVFPKEANKKMDLIFCGVAAVLCVVVVFTPHHIYVLVLDVCHIGLLTGFGYACVVSIKAWGHKNQDARTLFFGILVAFPFIFLEILKNSALQIPIPFTHLVEFGVLSFLLFQVYVLANHYAMTYQELESIVKTKTAELTESNEIKNRMLAILSHDVRGPVNLLKATLSLFNKGHLSESELKPMTNKIESQAGTVSLLIENILLLMKSQMQGFNIQYETFLLGDWVESHLSLYTMQAAEKKIKLSCSIASDVKVKADKNVVSLVVRNVISNAIKFSPEESEILVASSQVPGFVMLTVMDQGKGMPPQQVLSVFRPKSIWSSMGTNKETGTGLGLKLCREFLVKMDTDFEILSSPEKGTTISIKLRQAT